MSQFSFEQKIEIVSKMALDYCNENGLKFKQYNQKFAELIYKDIITVVAAQALSNESALDVFKNLKRLYEGVE